MRTLENIVGTEDVVSYWSEFNIIPVVLNDIVRPAI
jgi:hypothetical protein